jgi:excisionase family DNA binding protein
MLSLRGAAARLGVCHKTVRAWIAQGEGPPVMVIPGPVRNTYRIDAAELERWIERRTKGARR